MKKKYNKATAEFVSFPIADIITASNGISLVDDFDQSKEQQGNYSDIFGL